MAQVDRLPDWAAEERHAEARDDNRAERMRLHQLPDPNTGLLDAFWDDEHEDEEVGEFE